MSKQAILVDIDGTVLNYLPRKARILQDVLGRPISPEEAIGHGKDIIRRYTNSEEEYERLRQTYWQMMLCLDERAFQYLKLDRPQPFAREVLSQWARDHQIVYFTGRLENTREVTVSQLKSFSLPFDGSLFMAMVDEAHDPPEKVKARLFEVMISRGIEPFRVVDDIPHIFVVYKDFGIKERIGFCTGFYGYTPELYLQHGATMVIKSWKELLNESKRDSG